MVGLPQDWAVSSKGHNASSQATQTLVESVSTDLKSFILRSVSFVSQFYTIPEAIPDPDS